MNEQLFLTIGTAICGALITAIGVLWKRMNDLDARADVLMLENGKAQARIATLEAELARERQRSTELQQKVTILESDLAEAHDKITRMERENRRLKDENRIFRSTFEKQGVHVAQPERRAVDRVEE